MIKGVLPLRRKNSLSEVKKYYYYAGKRHIVYSREDSECDLITAKNMEIVNTAATRDIFVAAYT